MSSKNKMTKQEVLDYLENIKHNLDAFDSSTFYSGYLNNLIEFLNNNFHFTPDEEDKVFPLTSFRIFDNENLSVIYKEKYAINANEAGLIYKFLSSFSGFVNININSYFDSNQDKINIVQNLKTEETQAYLDLAKRIYVEKKHQDEQNSEAYKSEIIKKLEIMKNDAESNVKKHTYLIALLFSLLFAIPIAIKHTGIYKLLNEIIPNYMLYALVYIPIMSFIWYFFQQRSYAVKISTDYQFKLNSFNLFLYSHNWIETKITDQNMKSKTYQQSIDNLLNILADNPTRLYEKETQGLPIDEVISLVKEIIKKEK